ncbi:MFS transporter [Streptomyces sp. ML-6]|uniref:MFS transporter n=1 Tax=Streptomyces sp. ML-6 TaxID=2982693 RepID=UPI0024BFE6EB|nr:MFS transporter [Streptomyces sp. ML-6]MDK0522840.1 MFS transporter [Streptomyces sp. ML-6]
METFTPASSGDKARTRSLLPVVAIALCTFLVVSSEMMPVGVLTPMAGSLGISEGVAGLSLTITGLVAAVVATVAPALVGRADRRGVLVLFMCVLTAANALTALAPDFLVLAGARVLLGVSMGMVWGLAAGLGSRLAEPGRAALATTLIFSGVSIASVLGVPLGTFVADSFGWRSAFWALSAAGAFASVLLLVVLPPVPVAGRVRLGAGFGVLRNPGVSAGIAISVLVVLGHFAGYTYVRPFLESEAGLSPALVAAALLAYGVAGVLGNFVVGSLAGKSARAAVMVAVGGVVAATSALAFGGGAAALSASVLLVVWGLGYGGVSVSTQTWTAAADPERVEASSALWAGAFNASIAVGSVAGGAVIDGAGETAVMRVAAFGALCAFVVAVVARPRR